MKIELWSDYACPYCYIGKVRLEKALKKLNHTSDIEIIMRSFELDPNASHHVVSTTLDRFSKKYGLSKDMATQRIQAITNTAVAEGLDFKYISTRYTNTLQAHRLTKYAQSKGKNEIVEKLFYAYFTDNLELSNTQVLLDVAESVGLDIKEVEAMLASDAFIKEVREDEMDATKNQIYGVPYFLINKTYAVSGAQPVEMLYQSLKEILKKENSDIQYDEEMVCGVDGCSIERVSND